MKNVVTAIRNRDSQTLQQIYGADKPKQQVPEQAITVFNSLFKELKAAFPALMATIKEQDDLNQLRRQWVLAFAATRPSSCHHWGANSRSPTAYCSA